VCEQTFFSDVLKQSGATPLLWTNNLMAPEAYVLSAAIDGWMKKESDEQIRLRAADTYNSVRRESLMIIVCYWMVRFTPKMIHPSFIDYQ